MQYYELKHCCVVLGIHHVWLEFEQFADHRLLCFEVHRCKHIRHEGILPFLTFGVDRC